MNVQSHFAQVCIHLIMPRYLSIFPSRWCVTGTPINRGLEDLYGLMYFLHAAPLHQRFWWNRVCQRPTEAGSPAGAAQVSAAAAGPLRVSPLTLVMYGAHLRLLSSLLMGKTYIMSGLLVLA